MKPWWIHTWKFYKHHTRHRHYAPTTPFLGITHLIVKGNTVSKVTLTATVPTTRKSGSPLAITDIDHIALLRNGTQIDQTVPTSTSVQFVDSSPLTGNDDYTALVFTKDGFVSDPSNDAVVTIAAADPSVAITDLKATVS